MKLSIRSMFIAPKGKLLVSVDLSQAESWIVAYSAQEENMIYSLNYSDIHTDTASALFSPDNYCQHIWKKNEDESRTCIKCADTVSKTGRYIGKRYNHASSYRMKAHRAMEVINKDSDKPPYITVTSKESDLYSERWHKRYPNVKNRWWKEIEVQLSSNRTITTVYGRKRTFFRQWGDELFKEATAFIPQSTVADHFNGAIQPELGIKGGLLAIYQDLIYPYRSERAIINQSHDSCIIEVPAGDARDCGFAMQTIIKRPLVIKNQEFTIPVDGEIGERWGELEPLR
jgi:DNA polymerase I-like protein with 3'-5' exonuclease and polymerase domains